MHEGNLVFCKHSQLPLKRHSKRFIHTIKFTVMNWSARGFETALLAFLINNSQREQGFAEAPGDRRTRDASSIANLQHRPFNVYQGAKMYKTSTATANRRFLRIEADNYFVRTVKRPTRTFCFLWNGPRFEKQYVPPIDEIIAQMDGTQVFYKCFALTVYPASFMWNPAILQTLYPVHRLRKDDSDQYVSLKALRMRNRERIYSMHAELNTIERGSPDR